MTSPRAETELARIAHHEAGHAVAATLLGRTVGSLAISADHTYRGDCRLYDDPALEHPERPDEYAAAVRRTVAIKLAGPIAEEMFLGFAPMQPPKRCRADVLEATNMACRLRTSSEARAALLPAAERRVRRLFRDPRVWARVLRIAATLQAERMLAGDSVRELIAA